MYIRTIAALGLVVAGVAACGDDPAERALTGGAIGAAGGAAAGGIVGDPATGALAGAAAGAAAGALTDEEDIDLGDNPFW
jgi:hypothetical protein